MAELEFGVLPGWLQGCLIEGEIFLLGPPCAQLPMIKNWEIGGVWNLNMWHSDHIFQTTELLAGSEPNNSKWAKTRIFCAGYADKGCGTQPGMPGLGEDPVSAEEDCIPPESPPVSPSAGPWLLAGWIPKSSLCLGWKEGGRSHLHDKCQRPEAICLGALSTSVALGDGGGGTSPQQTKPAKLGEPPVWIAMDGSI